MMLLVLRLLGAVEMVLFQICGELAALKAQDIVLPERLVDILGRVRLASALANILDHALPVVHERTHVLMTTVV